MCVTLRALDRLTCLLIFNLLSTILLSDPLFHLVFGFSSSHLFTLRHSGGAVGRILILL